MTKDLLWRGMLAGILAAVLAMGFARVVAEPQIDRAIAYESAHELHHPGMSDDEPVVVSRATQKGIGLFTALVLFGAAIGGTFSLVFAYGYGRFGLFGPRTFALMLAGFAFLCLVVVPDLKYPPNPPAVGRPETIDLRTTAYFAMIALSVFAAIAASRLRTTLRRGRHGTDAGLYAVGAYLVVILVGQFLLPAIDEVPADFPATVLWNFRIASIGTQLLLWATIGIAFGRWAETVLRRQRV